MRLWTLHPGYLDARGLIALWREALLAQKVLSHQTRGYRNHPQLHRFRSCPDPHAAIAAYLTGVAEEGDRRGYRFDRSRIVVAPADLELEATLGQISYEWEHLMRKLRSRAPDFVRVRPTPEEIVPHPLFRIVEGPAEPWERVRTDEPPPSGRVLDSRRRVHERSRRGESLARFEQRLQP